MSQKTFWQLFNVLARITGIGFTFVGGLLTLWGISLLLDRKATIGVDGVPSSDPWMKAVVLFVGVVVCVLGLWLLKARPFRPDLGDSAFTKSQTHSDDKRKML